MVFSWKVNVILGVLAFLFTYIFSFLHNTWQTSLYRACIGLFLFFIIGYCLQFVTYQILTKKKMAADQTLGRTEGYTITKDGAIGDGNLTGEEPSFRAISLQSLHTNEDTKNSESL